jgi:hypothetical protein
MTGAGTMASIDDMGAIDALAGWLIKQFELPSHALPLLLG